MSEIYQTLIVTREPDGLVLCTLNRPERLNAMSPELVDELHLFLDRLHDDTSARVVLLRGAGRGFCAGLDLQVQSGGSSTLRPSISASLRGQHKIAELVIKMRRLPQPFIALVHGAAAGGGFALALASDIRIGLGACDIGSSYFLPRLVGASVAAELLLTGDFIAAPRALATGLVSRVVPDAELEKAGREMAAAILRNSPVGVRLTKDCLNWSLDAPTLEAAIAMEDRNQILASQSGDFREGVRAFLEKRPPRYTGD